MRFLFLIPSLILKKLKKDVQALINSESKVNTMTSAYVTKLDLWTQKTNVDTQKIDSSVLATYGIVIAAISLSDMLKRIQFFKETFLLTNFTFSNTNI